MAVIYLKHDVHGTKVAIAEDEAVADEKHGWKRFSPGAAMPLEKVYTEPTPAPDSAAPDEPEVTLHRRGRRRKEQEA
jgi:hypothetical protein